MSANKSIWSKNIGRDVSLRYNKRALIIVSCIVLICIIWTIRGVLGPTPMPEKTLRPEMKPSPGPTVQEAKIIFEENIEEHYNELIAFIDNKQFKSAVDKVSLFKKYKKLDYKNVEDIHSIANTNILEEKLKKLPASDIFANLKIYKQLLVLNPSNSKFKNLVNYYQKERYRDLKERRERELKASCKLEILSSGWSKDYGYAIYEGQVRNISNSKLENVEAVVTWYDENGNMITSSSALIKYNPILPGQASPFKVMKTYNPAMEKAGVDFSYLMGGTIRTYRKK